MQKNSISVIIPIYGCANSLNELYKRLVATLIKITDNFEIIMVDDSSLDNAWNIIESLSLRDNRVKGISLSRNFGQHYAITAGLDYTNSEWIVVMDCDLQDRPEDIIKLYNRAMDGYKIVFGSRVNREDSYLKKLGSQIFYRIYGYLSNNTLDSSIANFSIISNDVVLYLRQFKEQDRMYPLFINLIGFKRCNIDIKHSAREYGKSSYSLFKLIKLAIDSIISHSDKLLKLSIKFGFLLSFFTILYAIWLIIRYFIYNIPVEGWTSMMVSIYFIGGLLFINIGILGLYIGKIFNETKRRPLYFIEKTTFDILRRY